MSISPGDKARINRVSKLLTQEDIAEHSGLSITQISLYENSQLHDHSIGEAIRSTISKIISKNNS